MPATAIVSPATPRTSPDTALGRPALLLYALAFCVAVGAFVHLYEEPALARRFGQEYHACRSAVPAWRPRLRPWSPDGPRGVG